MCKIHYSASSTILASMGFKFSAAKVQLRMGGIGKASLCCSCKKEQLSENYSGDVKASGSICLLSILSFFLAFYSGSLCLLHHCKLSFAQGFHLVLQLTFKCP